jgi:hypothetical protein
MDIFWKEKGALTRIRSSIAKREHFSIVFEGVVGSSLSKLFGAQAAGLTPTQIKFGLIALGIISLSLLLLYALSKAYSIKGKYRGTGGDSYEFELAPGKP